LLNSLQKNGNRGPLRTGRINGLPRELKPNVGFAILCGSWVKEYRMFIAMNRFKVRKGSAHDFEQVWLTRKTQLEQVPGFMVFHLLKGPKKDDHVLYASHSVWRSQKHFEAWTRSEAFRKAHAGAGAGKPLYLGHPEFEGFNVLQEVKADGGASVAAE
jgi:heme-degrading monooxygenase HmoA